MDIKVKIIVVLLGMLANSTFGGSNGSNDLQRVLSAMISKGHVSYETNRVDLAVEVKRVTLCRFYLYDSTSGAKDPIAERIEDDFEREFANLMQKRHQDAYAAALHSSGNPGNPALSACWRYAGECVKLTQLWKEIVSFTLREGYEGVSFVPPEKFYLKYRTANDRRFNLSGWAFRLYGNGRTFSSGDIRKEGTKRQSADVGDKK